MTRTQHAVSMGRACCTWTAAVPRLVGASLLNRAAGMFREHVAQASATITVTGTAFARHVSCAQNGKDDCGARRFKYCQEQQAIIAELQLSPHPGAHAWPVTHEASTLQEHVQWYSSSRAALGQEDSACLVDAVQLDARSTPRAWETSQHC